MTPTREGLRLNHESFMRLWGNYIEAKAKIERLEAENQALREQLLAHMKHECSSLLREGRDE